MHIETEVELVHVCEKRLESSATSKMLELGSIAFGER